MKKLKKISYILGNYTKTKTGASKIILGTDTVKIKMYDANVAYIKIKVVSQNN